jgi:predicted XRE-type DNA-binding protein
MSKDDFKLVRGSGNIFQDFGHPNADLEQARAILAANIIDVLDRQGLTARAAEKLTGVSHTDLSRIRNAKLGRFTLDRMIAILGKLDPDLAISIEVKPRGRAKAA